MGKKREITVALFVTCYSDRFLYAALFILEVSSSSVCNFNFDGKLVIKAFVT